LLIIALTFPIGFRKINIVINLNVYLEILHNIYRKSCSVIIAVMNKQTGLIAGTTLLFISSVIIFLGRLATSVVIARTLGPEFKGIYSLTLLCSGMVIIASNLGLNGALTYYGASQQYTGKQLFVLSLAGGIILSVIGGAIFFLAYKLFFIHNILADTDPTLIFWVMLALPVNLLISFLSSLLLGQQRMVAYNLVNITNIFTNLGFQIISSILHAGVSGAIIAWIASSGVALLLALWYLRHEINLRLGVLYEVLAPALSYGGKSYISNLLQFFNYRLDSFLVNFFSGVAAVGQYTTSVSVAELLWYLPNAVSGALFPKVSSIYKGTANRLTPQACRQTLLLVFVGAIIFGFIGGWVIVGFYGEAFHPAIMPFIWLLPGMIGLSIAKIVSADLSGRGKPQYAAYTAGITVVLTVILDVLLIPAYNISGAAIASSISYITSGLFAVFWFNRETGVSPQTLLIPRFSDVRLLIERSMVMLQNIRHYALSRR
jgi:O-antigen/teichoic acid export membrane protein